MEKYMRVALSKNECCRCTARSVRTGVQCGRPALKKSKTQKCQFHGGRSLGPKIDEGKVGIANANTVHGHETKLARTESSAASVKLKRLEDAMHLLGMTTAPLTTDHRAQAPWLRTTKNAK